MGEGEGQMEGAGHSEWYVALTVAALTPLGGIGPWVAGATIESTAAIESTTGTATAETDAGAESVACSCQRCGRRASVAVS